MATLNMPTLLAVTSNLRPVVTMSPCEPVPDWPKDRPTRVTWTLEDGSEETEEVLSARGGPDLPFSPQEIRDKIHGIVGGAYPAMPGALDAILDLQPAALAASWADAVTGMTKTSHNAAAE